MQIKKNKSPKLEQTKMLCDKILDKKMEKYELTKFINCHSSNLIIGKPGSGKTSLLYSLFATSDLLRNVFHNIFLFQPTPSRASMKDPLFDELPDENKFDELTKDNLEEVITRIEEEPDLYHCIIFDDMTAYLRDTGVKKLLKKLCYNRRHMHVSIYFLCQTYLSLEPDIRKCFSNLFIFKVSDMELEKIIIELAKTKKDLVNKIGELVYDLPHNFLFLNADSGRMFKNWDEIIF